MMRALLVLVGDVRMRIVTLVLCAVLWSLTSAAQAAFPLTVKAYWNPNVATDSVTSYTIALDGGTPVSVGIVPTNDTNCPAVQYPQGCILAPVVIPASGQHTFAVTAVNQWGNSLPTTVTVNINNPGQIVWVKLAK